MWYIDGSYFKSYPQGNTGVSVNKIVDNIFFHVLTQQDDTSGDYKRTLLKLCGGDDE